MEILATSLERFNNTDLDIDVSLEYRIISNNTSIPIIITNKDNKILGAHNFDSVKSSKKGFLEKELLYMQSGNKPIVILKDLEGVNEEQYIYYKDSSLLNKLKYFPGLIFLFVVLLLFTVYFYWKNSKESMSNMLWNSMAKETAHQLGTPLTSLLGWSELMDSEDNKSEYFGEIIKDITRLQTIADRFSKIGSKPKLNNEDLIFHLKNNIEYLDKRSSDKIRFTMLISNENLITKLNPVLFNWVIENLLKNSIDSIKGEGQIEVKVIKREKTTDIYIKDSGKGIERKNWNKVFRPGFSTKKRGWGMGLSLAKRVIEKFHKGKIYIKYSEINKGTTIVITLNRD
ncbi:MAG: HAMP domain-containing histidine kinase [Flavobacteriaceae bacterium]|nr:HAMP domain-containing histidine kinase [Flavobacteriaceae bacterium]